MSDKEALQRIIDLGNKIVDEISANSPPTFRTVSRSRGNIIFDDKYDYLRLGDKTEVRKFVNVSSARRFMQTMAISGKIKKFIEENLHTSIRGLYYQLKFSLGDDLDEEIFSEQSESNALVEDLEVALGSKREDFHLTTDRKGVLAGPIVLKDTFAGEETIIDGTKQGRSGWMIPSDVDNGMEFLEVNADYALVVEKDALWQRLNEDRFWKKENALLVTPKGQSSRGTRRLLRRIADTGIPIYALVDCDAWGWYIYWTIKTGSMNLAYLGKDFTVPEMKFMGVTMRDIETYDFLEKLTIKAKDVDLKRAQEMLNYPWINKHKEWVRELKTVLRTKKKLEQDALQGEKLTFVGEYIREKIEKKDFLP